MTSPYIIEAHAAAMNGNKRLARLFELHHEAYEADEAFQKALVERYGKKAGDMRYRYDLPADIKALGDKFKTAMAAWSEAYQAMPR